MHCFYTDLIVIQIIWLSVKIGSWKQILEQMYPTFLAQEHKA